MSAPAPQTQPWYLLKQEDGSIFGPSSFEQLRQWAAEAQVSPLDKVSTDQSNWMRAPMLPDLGMDWLVEVSNDYCYGPTTLGAVGDFLRRGEIGPETVLLNARDGSSQRVADVPELANLPEDELEEVDTLVTADPEELESATAAEDDGEDPAGALEPSRTAIRFSLQQRIRELEGDLREERRLLTSLNERFTELEAKYVRLLGHQRNVRQES